jgi:hypothetical protein
MIPKRPIRRQHQFFEAIAERAIEPSADRRTETHLWPLYKLFWHQPSRDCSQQDLARAMRELAILGERRSELHESVIQQRRPSLKRVGHRGSVHLDKEVFG